jgi:hypothetical protein
MRSRGSELIGGAHELAAVLERQVTRAPDRFGTLVARFPDETHPSYFNALLRGFAHGSADSNAIAAVIRRIHLLPTRPCGREIADLFEKIDGSKIPDDLLDILAWYCTNDPDPDREWWRTDSSSGSHFMEATYLVRP